MALSSSSLATYLDAIENTTDEATAVQNLAGALRSYFEDGTVNGIPLAGAMSSGESLAIEAGTGLSASGAGPAVLTAMVTAFWTDIASKGAVYWNLAPNSITSIVAPAAGLAALPAALTAAFLASSVPEITKADALNAMATAIHASSAGNVVNIALSAGGTAVSTVV